jgi:aspartokinase
MKIVKFGGKSLANGEGINTVVNIIEGKIARRKNRYRGFSKRESN